MIDEFGFHGLHESILHLRHTSVSDELARLALCSNTINSQDNLGNTPLWWACARDDYKTALYLLHAGADPNIANKEYMTPFRASVRYGALKCANLLLDDASVDVISTHSKNATPLQLAIAYLRPLTKAFLDELLKRGVDIENVNRSGGRAIDSAIQHNEHTALQSLLRHGADYRHYIHGNTILHFLAWFGDFESVEIMRNACLSNIDIRAKCHYGATAMEVLLGVYETRPVTPSPEVIECFTQLLIEIEERTQGIQRNRVIEDMLPSSETTGLFSNNETHLSSEETSKVRAGYTVHLDDTDEEKDCDFYDAVESQGLDSPVVAA